MTQSTPVVRDPKVDQLSYGAFRVLMAVLVVVFAATPLLLSAAGMLSSLPVAAGIVALDAITIAVALRVWRWGLVRG